MVIARGQFKHTEDLEEWLNPIGYKEFWAIMRVYKVRLPNKDHCDKKIQNGIVEEDFVLQGLKYIAALQLGKEWGLSRRPISMPDYSVTA